MFKCQSCGTNSQPKDKQIKIVIETRHKQYYNENGLHTHGLEIVKEISVGPCCLDNMGQLASIRTDLYKHNFSYSGNPLHIR